MILRSSKARGTTRYVIRGFAYGDDMMYGERAGTDGITLDTQSSDLMAQYNIYMDSTALSSHAQYYRSEVWLGRVHLAHAYMHRCGGAAICR